MKTNTLKKVIFFGAVMVLILIFDFVLLSKLNKNYDYVIETRETIVVEKSRSGTLNETKKQIEELNKINDRIDNILISEANAVSFISLIEDISKESETQIEILDVEFEDPDEEEVLGILDMRFKVMGSWSSVVNFLRSLESLPYLINVNSIRFSASNSGEGIMWTVDFRLIGLTN